MERGNISIHTENIFPIIKKWLYSDKDIFVRELISNGCDAVHKLKRLVSLGEAKIEEDNDYKIVVKVNKDKKTLSFSDNGIGMTAEEVEKYITQVAFSGAEDFVKQYKESEDEGKQIIGHFGLGFYSAFMVSDKVQIDTLSYKDGSNAVKWVCDGGTEYEIGESKEQTSRGTTITLYINEESSEFLDNYKVRSVIEKYCSFMPVEIFFEDECAEKKDEEKETPINEIKPLWTKMPKDCSDEEYKELVGELHAIPDKMKILPKDNERIGKLSRIFTYAHNFLYLGRGYNYPVALEGALKLKEISYIHAEGYPAAEMKHGPIALIDEEMPVVIIATKNILYDKLMNNIQEIKARHGKVIALVSEGDTVVKNIADDFIELPHTVECLEPLLSTIPLQLLAYHIAVCKGRNVDQPRNLAKSVTVE